MQRRKRDSVRFQGLRELLNTEVKKEILWYYYNYPNLIGTLRDFSLTLNRSTENISNSFESFVNLGLVKMQKSVDLSSSLVEFIPPTCDEKRKLLEALIQELVSLDGFRREVKKLGYEENLIGVNDKMLEIKRMIATVSMTNATVLISGESGTGKELVAQEIHYRSLRRDKPFAVVDCATIPVQLFESELFGHERGSFTNALKKKLGKFELAHEGTIFLDEISEIPREQQAKLLRVLQERECFRVGGTLPIKLDIRLIAATNKDLASSVKEGGFREDLFYRLNVISINLPPLRERKDDIPLLAETFIRKICNREGKHLRYLSPEAVEICLSYSWPGNVRELENVIEHALVLCKGHFIEPDHLPAYLRTYHRATASPRQKQLRSLEELEADHIRGVLEEIGGNISMASKVLGIHRDTLYRKLKKYHIQPSS
ncbi:MAG: sigma-54 interaction domain-containing protein [Thermodesulfobacteriota bacterium]